MYDLVMHRCSGQTWYKVFVLAQIYFLIIAFKSVIEFLGADVS